MGVVGGSWMGLRKYYIVFWTESMLESDYFPEKRGKIWHECRCRSFCEKLKKFEEKSLETFAWKIGNFLGKSETSF